MVEEINRDSIGIIISQFDLLPYYVIYLGEMRIKTNNKNKRPFENFDDYLFLYRDFNNQMVSKTNNK
jgi:hypothetical protein|tara:strand:+ start:70 stop:270 length:201 start_codon:yes stop_codon:yes gene_type:complete